MGVIRWYFKVILDGCVACVRTRARNGLRHNNGCAGAPTAAAPSATAATAAGTWTCLTSKTLAPWLVSDIHRRRATPREFETFSLQTVSKFVLI